MPYVSELQLLLLLFGAAAAAAAVPNWNTIDMHKERKRASHLVKHHGLGFHVGREPEGVIESS